MQEYINCTYTFLQNQQYSIRNLLVQIGQLAKKVASKLIGELLSTTENKPVEHVKTMWVVEDKKKVVQPPKVSNEERKEVIALLPYKSEILYL